MVATIKRASDGEGLQWETKTGEFKISDVEKTVEGEKTSAKIAFKLQEELQAQMDFRVPIASLPEDDPDKKTDPARPNFFWDGTDLVARSNIITVAYVNGKYVPTVRVA